MYMPRIKEKLCLGIRKDWNGIRYKLLKQPAPDKTVRNIKSREKLGERGERSNLW